jgi:tetratricopeptide (TPR) repeat protein
MSCSGLQEKCFPSASQSPPEILLTRTRNHRRAHDLDPYNVDVLNNLAFLLHTTMGKSDEAEVLFRTALRIDPLDVDAMNSLGILLQTARFQYVEAESWFRRALSLRPDDVDVLNNLALLLQVHIFLCIPPFLFLSMLVPRRWMYSLSSNFRVLLTCPPLSPDQMRGELFEARRFLERALIISPADLGTANNLNNLNRLIRYGI